MVSCQSSHHSYRVDRFAGYSILLIWFGFADDLHQRFVGFAPCRSACMLQFARCIVPVQMGDLTLSGFIGIGGAVVAVECEVAIDSRIDAHTRNRLLLIGALDRSSER